MAEPGRSRGLDPARFEEDLEESLVDYLRGGDPRERQWSPPEEALLALRHDPGSLGPALRERLDEHFEAHPAERDAYEAFRSLASLARPAEEPGWAARAAGVLAAVLTPVARVAPVAIGLMLVVGTYVAVDPLGRRPLIRGGETPQAIRDPGSVAQDVVLTLMPSEPGILPAESLPEDGLIQLHLVFPRLSPPPAVSVRIARGDVTLHELEVERSAEDPERYDVALEPKDLPRGSYRISLVPELGEPVVYRLVVE
jgi:hypothetical protein